MNKKYFIAGILSICLFGCESDSDRLAIYSAWKSVNPQYKTTFNEWVILRNNKMLPGVDYARQAAENAETWSAINAGMQAGSRK